MIFNSAVFALFFAIVYSMYLMLRKHRQMQNLLLLIASYVFYGAWDWRFLFLLFGSTIVDYLVGLNIPRRQSDISRKLLLAISLIVNLSLLGFFKYFNFFAESTTAFFSVFGWKADPITLNIILPVGISFYTFQTLSYTIDIYRREITPLRNIIDFALYVSFFPQLVAGPIERSTRLIPQIKSNRKISATDVNTGIYLILWGYFKKMVIADNVAIVANQIFNNYTEYYGVDLWIGTLAFAIQIYCDFSAYSDIARGISRMMGFSLMLNFRMPYFSISPSDFWNRWHISLSSWLRDYLYIPLGGNRKGPRRTNINLMITMLLGGLWHGAAWNFVLWGAYQGGILVLYRQLDTKAIKGNPWKSGRHPVEILMRMAVMFVLTLVGWLFFRADSAAQIGYFLSEMIGGISVFSDEFIRDILYYAWPLLALETYQYIKNNQLAVMSMPKVLRYTVYALLLFGCISLSNLNNIEFIYFQF